MRDDNLAKVLFTEVKVERPAYHSTKSDETNYLLEGTYRTILSIGGLIWYNFNKQQEIALMVRDPPFNPR